MTKLCCLRLRDQRISHHAVKMKDIDAVGPSDGAGTFALVKPLKSGGNDWIVPLKPQYGRFERPAPFADQRIQVPGEQRIEWRSAKKIVLDALCFGLCRTIDPAHENRRPRANSIKRDLVVRKVNA